MRDARIFSFGPFRLDAGDERLWRGTEAVPLTAKAFPVLQYLVDHAGRLVPKDELVAAVRAVPYVSEAAVASCIRDIRRALGDQGQRPQFVETARGCGYRFVAPTSSITSHLTPSSSPLSPQSSGSRPPLVVGREPELRQLHEWCVAALRGERQLVFITEEAGIGKTTLADAYVAHVGAMPAPG
jgi:DNA-binding winged helix-turn-helix (wHTH) protein